MLIKNLDEQIISLAGLYQACLFVSNIAWKGEYNDKDFLPLVNSIYSMDTDDAVKIFIDTKHLKTGFNYLKKKIIDNIFTRNSETKRYVTSLDILSKKIKANPAVMNNIQVLLKKLNDDSVSLTLDEKAERISIIYQDTLSKLEPRIVVNGKNIHLTDNLNAARIRTALFSGLRATFLWEQFGGSKLKFTLLKIFYAKKIKDILKSMP
jgi:high frequency lysogenization protein